MKDGRLKGHVVRLDGEVLDCKRTKGETWADALDRMISGIPSGRTVIAVHVNGKQASRADLQALDGGDWIVDIHSEFMGELLKEVFSDLTLHLDSLTVVFQEIGMNLRRGNLPAVFSSPDNSHPSGGIYIQGLEGIVTAQVLVEEIGRIERQSGHDFFRVSFIEENDRIEAILSAMLKSQETQDWILLADLVEYEILPILQRGRLKTTRALSEVQEEVKRNTLVVA